MDKAERDIFRRHVNTSDLSKDYPHSAEQVIRLLDHIDALDKRLFGALETDKILKRAVENIDHGESISRSLMSDVVDLACMQKERIDALEQTIAAPPKAVKINHGKLSIEEIEKILNGDPPMLHLMPDGSVIELLETPPIPLGWKLVPVEPTEKMKKEGKNASMLRWDSDAEECYKAMIAAAPEPQS